MMKLIVTIFLIANLICLINAEFTCKQAEVINDFQGDELSGIWYLASRNPNIYEVTMTCVTYNTTFLKEDIIYFNMSVKNIYSEKIEFIDIYAKNSVEKEMRLFEVSVIGRDYNDSNKLGLIAKKDDSYIVFQGCNVKYEMEYLWVLTRERNITDEQLEELKTMLEEKGVNTKYLVKAQQDNCNN